MVLLVFQTDLEEGATLSQMMQNIVKTFLLSRAGLSVLPIVKVPKAHMKRSSNLLLTSDLGPKISPILVY